mmetsp:Transcript_123882/g.396632  ORF Transcript_123882/g.396632 Transcript_123882/m.396632 type:complete len:266 (+) Transcript_123882:861-1658(+)
MQQQLVVANYALIVAADAAQRARRPVLQPKHTFVALRGAAQALQHGPDVGEADILGGQRGKDGEEGRTDLRKTGQLEVGQRRRGRQCLMPPSRDLLQQPLRLGVISEVRADRLQQRIDLGHEPALQCRLVELARQEGRAQRGEGLEALAVGLEDVALPGEQHILGVVQAGVHEIVVDQAHALLTVGGCGDTFRDPGAVSIPDLALHILRRILHEDGAVGVRLRHFGLALLQAEQHVVRQDDGLQLAARGIAIVPRQHIDLSLIHA